MSDYKAYIITDFSKKISNHTFFVDIFFSILRPFARVYITIGFLDI